MFTHIHTYVYIYIYIYVYTIIHVVCQEVSQEYQLLAHGRRHCKSRQAPHSVSRDAEPLCQSAAGGPLMRGFLQGELAVGARG